MKIFRGGGGGGQFGKGTELSENFVCIIMSLFFIGL